MKKILFVTTRNIVSMCGEFNLICSRAIALSDYYGIDTEFFGFANKNKKNKMADALKRFKRDYTFYNKKSPFGIIASYRKFCKKVLAQVRENDYDCIIVSGVFHSNIAKEIKKVKDVRLVFDCHGTNDELIEFNKSFSRKLLYKYFNYREKQILRRVDGIFAVTEELKKHILQKADVKCDFYIVPCALNRDVFSYEEACAFREKWRKHFGIAEDETLFIYSGGVSPWQSIDDVYYAYKKYEKEIGKAKLLIMTPKLDQIKYEDVLKTSFPPETVGEVLFAGDVACLLRSNCMTNRVAFPNKYLEYVGSNMLILTTPYLPGIANDVVSENMGMLMSSVDDFDAKRLENLLKERNYEKDFPVRRKIIEKYSFKNCLKPFAEMLDK